jgi:hypothetical protein
VILLKRTESGKKEEPGESRELNNSGTFNRSDYEERSAKCSKLVPLRGLASWQVSEATTRVLFSLSEAWSMALN